jgi:hypothetical protein
MSTKRYLPAMGTAGFDRRAVKGDRREPAPPPKIIETVSFANTAIKLLLKMI